MGAETVGMEKAVGGGGGVWGYVKVLMTKLMTSKYVSKPLAVASCICMHTVGTFDLAFGKGK